MNINYQRYLDSRSDEKNIEDFRGYLLSQNTIIIPETGGELICSPGVENTIKEAPEIVSDKLFYRADDTIYFIYSQEFENIGEVKVLFDTTEYVRSQMTIIKISLIFILIAFIVQFTLGRHVTSWLLKDLTDITNKVKNSDIYSTPKKIQVQSRNTEDELFILAKALNTSYRAIDRQTNKLKQFLTDVSHEFKTPLMAMSSRIDLLEKIKSKKGLSEEDVINFMSLVKKQTSKLDSLLQTLFFISKLEENEDLKKKDNINVYDFFSDRLEIISQNYPHKKIETQIEISKNLSYSVDIDTFGIIVDNLLSNAIKFSDSEAKIFIKADADSFCVSDNGQGISENKIGKIWDKFYRDDTSVEGFGVGLYLVKRIIDLYDWEIEAKNTSIGAEFIITLGKTKHI